MSVEDLNFLPMKSKGGNRFRLLPCGTRRDGTGEGWSVASLSQNHRVWSHEVLYGGPYW